MAPDVYEGTETVEKARASPSPAVLGPQSNWVTSAPGGLTRWASLPSGRAAHSDGTGASSGSREGVRRKATHLPSGDQDGWLGAPGPATTYERPSLSNSRRRPSEMTASSPSPSQ